MFYETGGKGSEMRCFGGVRGGIGGVFIKLVLGTNLMLLFLVRAVLAWRFAGRFVSGSFAGSVAVLQPILGGDPSLEEALRANAVGLAGARLYWLVDEDDLVGQAAARGAALGNVRVIVGPGPVDRLDLPACQ